MVDFIKLFRRTKSIRQDDAQFDETLPHSRNSFYNEADEFDSSSNLQAIDTDCNGSSGLFAAPLDGSCHLPDAEIEVEEKTEDGFKEPKGWRKSLRRLRWRKKGPEVSISTENISARPTLKQTNHIDDNNSSKVNKRWSYSPDLCEENVPGARELRGTLERKLSIKIENDPVVLLRDKACTENAMIASSSVTKPTRPAYSCYHQDQRIRDMRVSSFSSPQSLVDHEQQDCSAEYKRPRSCYSTSSDIPTQPTASNSDGAPECLPHPQAFSNSWTRGVNSGNSCTTEYSGVEASWLTGNMNQNESHQNMPRLTSTVGVTEYSACQSNSLVEDTTDEDDDPPAFEDIDDILGDGDMNLRSGNRDTLTGGLDRTSRSDSRSSASTSRTLYSITGSLMRGRVGTQFEREAEFALEHVDYPPHFQDFPAHPDGSFRSYNNNENITVEHHPEPSNNSNDNQSWGSDEFDDDSDESDAFDKSDDAMPKQESPGCASTSSSIAKVDRTSKDPQKFKFWERNSAKKKSVSQMKDPEPEMSPSFIDVPIVMSTHVPQLPEVSPDQLSDIQRRRRCIVSTIISSEDSYLKSLQRLDADYKVALLENKIISAEVVEKIFYKISDILQCHKLFRIALAQATNEWDVHECIGEMFVASFSKSMVLECYGEFINNFTTAMDLMRKTCIRKPTFLTFLRERQAESSSRLNLYGLMLKPIQRFPQFIMLVQDLLKHTPSQHPDRLQLQLALTELEILTERLNQRKADDEDRADLRTLLESSNLKLPAHTKDGRTRKLVKQAEVRECEHNEVGLLEKMKECLLILTTDMLICCSVNNKGRGPHQRGYSTIGKDIYKLKWRVGLDELDACDGAPHASQLAKRESLHADFISLQKIAKLMEGLQLTHEGISLQAVLKSISELEIKIRQAEQTARHPDDSSFTVRFPGKSGSPASRTIVSTYASQKEEWLEAISLSKLANAPANVDSWFCTDGAAEVDTLWKPPLFLRSVSAHLSYETLQVQCAYAFMRARHVTLLWMSCAASTVLAVVSVYYIAEDRVEKVHVMQVESSVQCMEHWNPSGDRNSIWLGMESGCLLEYSTEFGAYNRMCEVAMPTMSTVMIMKAHRNNLYVGLLDGTLVMYSRPSGTLETVHMCSIIVGTGPLVCLSPFGDKLWGCSGNNVVTIDMTSFTIESSRGLRSDEGEEGEVVKLVTRVGSGLWVAFDGQCTLNLYHLETCRRLQDINLARIIRDFVQGLDGKEKMSEHCHVTSLWSGHSQLYVGTSTGLLLVMPLPKLPDSVPKITGPCKISRHCLNGPLLFLFAPDSPPPVLPQALESTPVVDQLPDIVDCVGGAGDGDAPPPVPERDDLDRTLVAADIDRESPVFRDPAHQSLPTTPHRPTSASRPSVVSPGRPPPMKSSRPRDLHIFRDVSDILPEAATVYANKELQSIESPRKFTFMEWKHSAQAARHCPVVIACGQGYRRLDPRSPSHKLPASANDQRKDRPAILCWKVVT